MSENARPFVHLHCHSHFSLLDGASPIKKLVGRAKELGMTIVDPPREEIEKARQASRAAWEGWLKRTGANGKRALDLALKALGRS